MRDELLTILRSSDPAWLRRRNAFPCDKTPALWSSASAVSKQNQLLANSRKRLKAKGNNILICARQHVSAPPPADNWKSGRSRATCCWFSKTGADPAFCFLQNRQGAKRWSIVDTAGRLHNNQTDGGTRKNETRTNREWRRAAKHCSWLMPSAGQTDRTKPVEDLARNGGRDRHPLNKLSARQRRASRSPFSKLNLPIPATSASTNDDLMVFDAEGLCEQAFN